MSGCSYRSIMAVVCVALLVPLTGCPLAADLVNPAFLSAFGFDPDTIILPEGRVLVTFNNQTQFPATFAAAAIPDMLEVAGAITLTATNVDGNTTRTLVVDCPVDVIAPGVVGVLADGALVELLYEGSPLVSGSDFQCGDVIEMRVVQAGGGADATTFVIQVEVLAGR